MKKVDSASEALIQKYLPGRSLRPLRRQFRNYAYDNGSEHLEEKLKKAANNPQNKK